MRRILVLLSVAVVATLAWGAYWFVGARALDRAVTQVLAANGQLAAQGHQVRGFPNRFDLTLDAPRIAVPGLAWQAPFVQFFALTYRPHHLVAVFPHDQRIDMGSFGATLHSTDMRASVVMDPSLSLSLQRAALVAESPELVHGQQTQRADALRLASRALAPERHELAIEIERAFPDAGMMNMLDPQALWPRRFDILRLEGEVTLDRPLDRHVMQGAGPVPIAHALTGGRIAWLDDAEQTIDIRAQGRLEPDAAGRLSGDLTLDVTRWQTLLRRARDAGWISPEHAVLAEMALQSMVDPETPDQVQVALRLRAGDIMMGPVMLGTLPPLF